MIAVPAAIDAEALSLPRPGDTLLQFGGQTMGTTWAVACYAPPSLTHSALAEALQAALAILVGQMSHWEQGSDLSRFNRAPAGTWLALPPEFFAVLQSALHVARDSEGAFDPALGFSSDRWGFGPSGARLQPPEPVSAHPPSAGWRGVQMDYARRLALQPGGVSLDFSSIAKGFAVDHLAALLRAAGIRSYLVEIGGELFGWGVKPDGQPWWVDLEPPPHCPIPLRIALCGLSAATSGGYRRFFEHQGRRYAHTLDPRTGEPLAAPPASVTVIHPTCMGADAWSTALLVLGVEYGLQLANQKQIAAFFIEQRGERWQASWSRPFDAMLS